MINTSLNIKEIYFSQLSIIEMPIYQQLVFQFLKKLKFEYPSFTKWYSNLFSNGVLNTNREIIICEAFNVIVAVAILKYDEKKICTFRVSESFQKNGIGKHLMEKCFEVLETDKPLITVHNKRRYQYNNLFQYYGFTLEQTNHFYYWYNTELAYNGVLPEKNILINKVILIDYIDFIDKMWKVKNELFKEIQTYTETYKLYDSERLSVN